VLTVIDAKEGRDIMVADVPDSFVQTTIEPKEKGERVITKIRGPILNMQIELNSQKYEPYRTNEGGNKFYMSQCSRLYMVCFNLLCYTMRNSEKVFKILDLKLIIAN
jgi:hypothetical protein